MGIKWVKIHWNAPAFAYLTLFWSYLTNTSSSCWSWMGLTIWHTKIMKMIKFYNKSYERLFNCFKWFKRCWNILTKTLGRSPSPWVGVDSPSVTISPSDGADLLPASDILSWWPSSPLVTFSPSDHADLLPASDTLSWWPSSPWVGVDSPSVTFSPLDVADEMSSIPNIE